MLIQKSLPYAGKAENKNQIRHGKWRISFASEKLYSVAVLVLKLAEELLENAVKETELDEGFKKLQDNFKNFQNTFHVICHPFIYGNFII